MIHSLKLFWFGLIVLATIAMVVSVAQAEKPAQITIEGGSGIGRGTQPVEPKAIFSREGRTITCNVGKGSDTVLNGDTTFSGGTPQVEQCHSPSLKAPATVTTNGCEFVFHLTATTGDKWTAISDFVCPEGKKGEITIYISEESHAKNIPLCRYEFTSQSGLGTIELTNEPGGGETPKDWILSHVTITGIKSTRTAGTALNCGALNNSSGSLTGTVILVGEDHAGNPKGITISTK